MKTPDHLHLVGRMEYRSKPDSVDVTCLYCGEIECFAAWHNQPPLGWDPQQYPEMQEAIIKFLAWTHNSCMPLPLGLFLYDESGEEIK